MCGIAGIINLDGQSVRADDLQCMNECIAHRGPDGDGFFCDRNVGLAHRRLAIIDPRGGIQPFYNDDRSIVLSFNGEVYNYLEIQRELESEFNFKTQSDTEVVVRAYEKWGIACLERFRGMFAFALYDSKERVSYLVRDRVGIKPLFYYQTPERLLFASEILAILKAGGVQRDVSVETLSAFFRYQYVPTPATVYRNMHKLEPGCYLKIDTRSGQVSKHQYWNLAINIVERSESDWLEELNALLDDTIRIYVRSDVPFGAFLSGGVDSSLVTALMARHLDHPVRTFTIGFKEEVHSELPFAAEASRTIKTNHYEKIVSPQLAEEILGTMIRHFGEPFADSSAIPTYYVAREAASQVKMVLSGDGGDELFGGYNSYQTTFRDFTSPARRAQSSLFRLLMRYGKMLALANWARHQQISPYQPDHDAQRQIFGDSDLRRLLVPDLPITPPVTFKVDIRRPEVDPLTMFQAQDFKTYMVDDVLTKVDRMSMANSLEVRVPLLDHKVVELAFSLPLSLKLRYNEAADRIDTKYLLKKSAARFYSEEFLARRKQGFGIPVIEWCKGSLRPMIENRLRHPQSETFAWTRFEYVQALLDEFYAGNDLLTPKIWFLLMFDLWIEYVHHAA
jgi:asparagine synthase (glutamine-hydrolysing)